MEKIQRAIQFFLKDLGLHQHHVILANGDDVMEFRNTMQPGAGYTEIVISLEPQETNHGECYNISPYLIKIDPALSLLRQLIVLAHELKHVQEYVKQGETSEDSAHAYDWRGAWLGLQWKLLTLQQYKQLIRKETT